MEKSARRRDGETDEGMEKTMKKRMHGQRTEEENGFPRIYTAKEIAGILKVSVDTVYRKSGAGELPKPLPYSRLLRWHGDEFDEWVAAGCVGMKRSRARRGGENGKGGR
jgi:excisionase family DNA binding protein